MPKPKTALICVLPILITGAFAADQPDSREFFEMRVRPVLARNCFACHTSERKGGLEMMVARLS